MQKTATKTSSKVKTGVVVGLLAVSAVAAAFATLAPRMVYPTVSLTHTPYLGVGVPGEHEVMYFSMETRKSDARLQEITFEVDSTDNAGTGWNTCGELGEISSGPVGWSIYDMASSTRIDTDASWAFYDSANVNCADASVADHPVAYAVTTTPLASVIPASTRSVSYGVGYVVFADTTGASAAYDDSFRLSITNSPAAILWEDDHGLTQNARYISGLPVTGTTITY